MMKIIGHGAVLCLYFAVLSFSFKMVEAKVCPYESGSNLDDSDFQDKNTEVVVDDMIFSSRFNPRLGCGNEEFRWPNATLVFNITDDFTNPEVAVILKAMEMISADTCIKFREQVVGYEEADIVEITKTGYPGAPSGCAADLGRKGGKQSLYLAAPGCINSGVVAHELMHSLGIMHEQQRPDRDNNVTIHWSNIQQNARYNFDKYDASVVSTFDLPYDFSSIMHYKKNAFAINSSKPTITCNKNGSPSDQENSSRDRDYECELGQRGGLTELDKEKLRRMYKCDQYSS